MKGTRSASSTRQRRSRRPGSRLAAAWLLGATIFGAALGAPSAEANVWPSSHERIVRALASPDVVERRAAASNLLSLPPEIARPLAVQALLDPDVEVRLHAARAVTELGAQGVGDTVVSWLSDPEPRLRVAACKLIEASPSPAAVQSLGRVLGDADAEVRKAAALAMGASGLEDAVPALLGHLDDGVAAIRLEVVRALGRIGDRRAVVPLVSKLQDPEPDVRKAAARALGALGDAQGLSTLMLALQDSVEDVRNEALGALGQLRAGEAVSGIAALLASDEASSADAGTSIGGLTREVALRALGQIASPQALKILIDELEHEGASPQGSQDPGRAPVRAALVLAGPAAIGPLTEALRSTASPKLASGAALALGELGAEQAVPMIVRGAQRGTVSLEAAFRALGALGDREALPFLLEHLDDSDAAVRQSVVSVAAKLLDPTQADGRAVDPVKPRVLDVRTPLGERIALVKLLGRTGSVRAQQVLLELGSGESNALRLAAMAAMGELRLASTEADALLLAAMSDSSARLRLVAATALGRIGTDSAARTLLDRFGVSAEQDRGAVGLALSGVLSRSRAPDLVARVGRALEVAPASGRDALIEGLGRMPVPEAGRMLVALADKAEADDRRKIAEALGAHPSEQAALRKLAADPDPTVRANALWSLGRLGTAESREVVAERLRDTDVAAAGNAAAALARISMRDRSSGDAAPALCALLTDHRSYVRVNALFGLRLIGKDCADHHVRQVLLADRSWRVRQAAAELIEQLVSGAPATELLPERRALGRCSAEDRDATVAASCAEPRAVPAGGDDVLVLVVPQGRTEPEPRAAFALELADGSLRLGVADRRGAVFELAAPRGTIRLVEPAALAP